MSSIVQIRFPRESAKEIDAALAALAPSTWAFELYERRESTLLLALVGTNDPDSAKIELARILAGSRAEVVGARAAKVVDGWVGWKPAAHLVQVGPLWIAPTRVKRTVTPARLLRIETKHAFGSGLHETTLLCLERILELSPLDELLDVGTGTGVLSIAALALGARHAVGLDIDPKAVDVARANAKENGYDAAFDAAADAPDALGRTFPFVVANIIAPVLHELAARIAPAVAAGGTLVLSGLRAMDIERVGAAYSRLGLVRRGEATLGGWARLELHRAAEPSPAISDVPSESSES